MRNVPRTYVFRFLRKIPAGAAYAILSTLLLSALARTAIADDYRLGVQDKLAVRVVEWRIIENEFREWTSVSGQYAVGPSGTIAVPFVGELQAAGHTTSEISASISATLKEKFGLKEPPETSVEIAQYRPFFVSGTVQSPGQYPYMPGLTVLKALAVAGGIQRDLDGWQRGERDLITAKGNHDVFSDERLRLLVRRERIRAEMEGRADFSPPEVASQRERIDDIVSDERAIMRARQKKLSLRLQALADLKQLLESEIVSLEKKKVTQERQIDLARKELAGVGALAQQGLVVSTRVLGAERTIADMEGKILDLDTAILRAKQDISKGQQDTIDLRNAMDAELAEDRQKVEADLKAMDFKITTQMDLMAEALRASPMSMLAPGAEPSFTYTITKTDQDGKVTEIGARLSDAVGPGDVVTVKRQEEPLTR